MTNRTNNRRRRGFTLVELVVVVLVIGIIAAAAAPKMFNTATEARENSTRHSLGVVRDAIELYRADNNSYPAAISIDADLAPYLKGPFPAAQVGNTNATVGTSGANPIAVSGGSEGWVYNATTGDFAVNDASYITW